MKYLGLLITVLYLQACATTDNSQDSGELRVEKGLKAGLDLLLDYDRDAWPGPYSWSSEQWLWKKRLRWSKDCDYIGDVSKYTLKADLDFIVVTCVFGAYQPSQYLYTYKTSTQKGELVKLRANKNSSFKVWGELDYNKATKRLTVFNKGRGLADCGSYEVYDLNQMTNATPKLVEWRKRECTKKLSDNYPQPTEWPLQDLGSN